MLSANKQLSVRDHAEETKDNCNVTLLNFYAGFGIFTSEADSVGDSTAPKGDARALSESAFSFFAVRTAFGISVLILGRKSGKFMLLFYGPKLGVR